MSDERIEYNESAEEFNQLLDAGLGILSIDHDRDSITFVLDRDMPEELIQVLREEIKSTREAIFYPGYVEDGVVYLDPESDEGSIVEQTSGTPWLTPQDLPKGQI